MYLDTYVVYFQFGCTYAVWITLDKVALQYGYQTKLQCSTIYPIANSQQNVMSSNID